MPDIYYPTAVKDLGGRMKERTRYAHGFPVAAVIHSTDGRPNSGEDSVRFGVREGIYAYFVIGRGGSVFQNFSLDKSGKHAGETSHPTLGTDVSQKLVGIEIVSAGKVKKIDDNRFRPEYNDPVAHPGHGLPVLANDFTRDQVNFREAVGSPSQFGYQTAGYYHTFTEEQEEAVKSLLYWMKSHSPEIFMLENVVGHDEVAVDKDDGHTHGRKSDPGGSLSVGMAEFRALLIAGWAP